MVYFAVAERNVNFALQQKRGCLMAENIPLTNQNASLDGSAPVESEGTGMDLPVETDLLEDELEELVIEDFTIDGICGVY
jgi:mycofactocin precursor